MKTWEQTKIYPVTTFFSLNFQLQIVFPDIKKHFSQSNLIFHLKDTPLVKIRNIQSIYPQSKLTLGMSGLLVYRWNLHIEF